MNTAKQRTLLFRNDVSISGNRFIDVKVSEVSTAKYAIMSIILKEYYKQNPLDFKSLYFPFKPGINYSLTYIINFATANGWTVLMTGQDLATAQVISLDIGTTSTPTSGSITSSGATISWTNTNTQKSTGINVYISTDSGQTYTKVGSTLANNATSKALTGLTTATAYLVKIAPVNQYGESAGLTVLFTTS